MTRYDSEADELEETSSQLFARLSAAVDRNLSEGAMTVNSWITKTIHILVWNTEARGRAEQSSVFQQLLQAETPERDEYEDEETYIYQRLSDAASVALNDNAEVLRNVDDDIGISSADPLVQEVLQDLRRCESSSVQAK
eukprot:7920983-Pyramimonas_sp.AAC.1